MKSSKLNLAILISGGGTTMQQILRACKDGRLPHVNPACVISSKTSAGGISRALSEGFSRDDIVIIVPKAFDSREAFGEAILRECKLRGIDLIAQCGFLPYTPANVIAAYADMIFNQHPGPLNYGGLAFGGKGMHGRAVHHAVLYFARRVGRPFRTEATVHRVVEKVDGGAVLGIRPVEIMEGDDAEKLAARVLPHEHDLVIETILRYSEFGGTQEIYRRIPPLIRSGEEALLEEAIAAGREAFPKG